MNEITFRTKLLTNPYELDSDMLAFLEQNPEKKQSVQKAREFDQKISDVLDVDVPEGLHARILLNQSYQQNHQQNKVDNKPDSSIAGGIEAEVISVKTANSNPNGWLSNPFANWAVWTSGIAASVIAFALLFNVLYSPNVHKTISGDAMVNHILAHIAEDPTLMTAVKLPSTESEMHQLFASVGAQLNKPVDGMSYAGICDVEGQKGLHIVMQENGQPITIIVMPGQQITAMQAFEKSGYHGELMPVKGGVVAIVANTMEQVALAQTRFFRAVKFA